MSVRVILIGFEVQADNRKRPGDRGDRMRLPCHFGRAVLQNWRTMRRGIIVVRSSQVWEDPRVSTPWQLSAMVVKLVDTEETGHGIIGSSVGPLDSRLESSFPARPARSWLLP